MNAAEHRVGLVQMVSSKDVDRNLVSAERLLLSLSEERLDAVFLPENFSALGNPEPRSLGESQHGPEGSVRSFLAEMAARLNCWIFAGTIPCSVRGDGKPVAGSRVRAASFVFDETGQEVARYDKIHMFDVEVEDNHRHYMESDTFEPGEDLVVVDSPIGKVGLSVCYDIRFPELYRHLVGQGAEHLCVPSAFTTTTGQAHWRLLMRARAVENACFTIGACQGGSHDSGRETHGHSMVVDPWGEVLGELGLGEDILVTRLDLEVQRRIRRDMPTLSQRRLS